MPIPILRDTVLADVTEAQSHFLMAQILWTPDVLWMMAKQMVLHERPTYKITVQVIALLLIFLEREGSQIKTGPAAPMHATGPASQAPPKPIS